jgi:hypothetical protein
LNGDALASAKAMRTLGGAGIHEDVAGVDELLDARAAELSKARGYCLIEALPRFTFCGNKFAQQRFVRLSHAEIVAVQMDCAAEALIQCWLVSQKMQYEIAPRCDYEAGIVRAQPKMAVPRSG